MDTIQQPLYTDHEWTPERIDAISKAIKEIADTELGLDYYPMQIRIITSEQMLDAYASNGMPVGYAHWSFGKRFLMNHRAYQSGQMGLAYEIVINTDPCLVYCMEDNTMTMQALVIAHAGFGHNAFFKNNFMFKQWTHSDSILDYLEFAKHYIHECEEKYGIDEVEQLIDACHALRSCGVDRYKRPHAISAKMEKERMEARREEIERNLSVLWRPAKIKEVPERERTFPSEPQENVLYFIEKHAPSLPSWKREVIRIIRKISQYFYPQMYTQVMNEGFACFTHYYIMTRLYEKRLITDGAYQEFLHSHTNVVFQPDFDATVNVLVGHDDEGKPIIEKKSIYRGINVYALGFNMFMDIKRMCEHPTAEDKKWFPHLAGTPWLPAIKNAVENFKDESFILQYLSPHLIRHFGFFTLLDDEEEEEYKVTAIHDDDGYRHIREKLAGQYERSLVIPDIHVEKVDVRGNRMLSLQHLMYNRKLLDPGAVEKMLEYVRSLWEYPVELSTVSVHDGSTIESWRLVDDEVEHFIEFSLK